MDRELVIRVGSLYLPAMLAAVPWMHAATRPSRRLATGAALACAWNVPALLLVNAVAIRVGWWSFAPHRASLLGVPADLLLGWVLLWGAVPVLLMPRTRLSVTAAVFVAADLLLMPLATPVVVLGDRWLIGEAAAVFIALVPALYFSRLTVTQQRVEVRAAMQAAVFSSLILWILPQVIFERLSGDWSVLLHHWHRFGGAHLQIAAIPAIVGMAAVREFAQRGLGTPFPFDAPRRLVTSGPYAYVANPMQLSMAVLLCAWAMILQSWWLIASAAMAVVYGVGLAAMDEGDDMRERFGDDWLLYRRHVRDWIPRWRPFHASTHSADGITPARLYVAAQCGRCSEVARWFLERSPLGLEIVPAESHPGRSLTRVTYDPGDGGREESGVAAVARALEHLHLGWALIAWMMRVPGLDAVLQRIVDASGGEPRTIDRSDDVRYSWDAAPPGQTEACRR